MYNIHGTEIKRAAHLISYREMNNEKAKGDYYLHAW